MITIRRKSFLTTAVIVVSAMTFALPREFFDPHLGVDVDIFCKSLYAIGTEAEMPVALVAAFERQILGLLIYDEIFLTEETYRNTPVRGPPFLIR